jgi:uncharacterized sulfatase
MSYVDTHRPNILWITTHDISPDLGCYAGVWPGAGYAHTPNRDRLAAEGARYDNDQLATWRELRRLHFEEANQLAVGEAPNRPTPTQRRFLATKPHKELYDLQSDPHDTRNLAGDPGYADDMQRLRDVLKEWQQTYGDLGLLPEAELIERWRPGSIPQETAPPEVTIQRGKVVATCTTEGASIGWTTDPLGPSEKPSFLSKITGDRETDGRCWQLYSGPFTPPRSATLWFRAQRLGYRASRDVAITVEP